MSTLTTAVRTFLRDEEGATMAEYALLVALIAVVVIAGARALGSNINNQLNNTANSVATPTP